MERARTEWLRAQGVDHGALKRDHGVQLVLTRVEAEFLLPSRLSDLLDVVARIDEARGARVVFGHEIRRGHRRGQGSSATELVCRGIAEVACVDIEQGRPRRLPQMLLSGMSK
jgi:acyl-CoA thioester hydrolase